MTCENSQLITIVKGNKIVDSQNGNVLLLAKTIVDPQQT